MAKLLKLLKEIWLLIVKKVLETH